MALTEECICIIQNRIPTNFKDPKSLNIEIIIGKCVEERGLYDLGASIILMPNSMFLQIGIGRTKPITIMLLLFYHLVSWLDDIIEDVLVQVGTLIFPVEFVIFDFEFDPQVPFMLGRQFLAMVGALNYVAVAKLMIRAHDKAEVIDVYKAMMLPIIYDDLSATIVIENKIR